MDLAKSRRDISIDASLGSCTLPVGEKVSSEKCTRVCVFMRVTRYCMDFLYGARDSRAGSLWWSLGGFFAICRSSRLVCVYVCAVCVLCVDVACVFSCVPFCVCVSVFYFTRIGVRECVLRVCAAKNAGASMFPVSCT